MDMDAVSKMTSAQLIEEIKKLSENVDGLQKKLTEAEKPADPVAPEAPKAPETPAPAAAPAENKELSEIKRNLDESQKTIKELKEVLKSTTDKNYVLEVETQLKAFSDAGMPPVIVDKARAIILSDVTGAKSFKLSEKKEDGTVATKDADLRDCVLSLMEAIPLVSLTEETFTPEASGESDIQIVKKYAEEHKMDFRSAYSKCLAEKKIKSPFNSGVEKE